MSDTDKKGKFSLDDVKEFCRKNVRYISAGVIFLFLLLVVWRNSGKDNVTAPEAEVTVEQTSEIENETEDYEKDAYPEINELITKYYKAYAKGDTDKLKKYATPISDLEKSYIDVFSKYVTAYENITCYTKSGLTEDSKIVSVCYEMQFKDVETLAPGLDFFYLEKDKDGKYYINNIYSQYNLANQESELDENIAALIGEFEQEEDLLALRQEVQEKYDKALESDKKLNKMASKTLQNAIAKWVESIEEIEVASADDSESEEKKEDKSEKKEDKSEEKKEDKSEEKKEDKSEEKKEDKSEEKKEDKSEEKKEDKSEEKKEDKSEKKEDKSDKKKEDKSEEKKEDKSDKKKEDKSEEKKEENSLIAEVRNETVYATTKVNARELPNETANVIAQVDAGTGLVRQGITADGWSAVEYNGATLYIKSDYLSTEQVEVKPQVTYLEEGKVIRLSEAVVVRSSMGEDASKLGTAFSGEKLTVVMSYEEGWTKVNWNGKEGYVRTDVLK